MRKIYGALMFLALSVFAFSLSGCGGSSSKFISNTNGTVRQVAVLTSPVFEVGKNYRIHKGAALTGMDNAQYYIANTGSSEDQATMNLGFSETLGSDTLAVVDTSTGRIVFAYNPSGPANTAITDGTLTSRDGGQILSYNSLNISSMAFSTALSADTSNPTTIILSGNTATINNNTAVTVYDHVWHSDPEHEDEYYTDGISGSEVTPNITDDVYIAHDIVYMPSGLEYTATVKNDDETEYAAYYSETVSASKAAELGVTGPFIFATLPGTMGGAPDGNNGGGNQGGGGDGTTPPEIPGGGGNQPQPQAASNVTASSYNSQISSTISAMTHTATEAYSNPVLHITKAGTYSLQGTWNGQIWIDLGSKTDESAKVVIILNSVDVTCTVAPAIVFYKAYECGPDDEDEVDATSMDIGLDLTENAGAMVVIADDTTNNFTGSNVYRMLKPAKKKDSVTTIDGTDVSQQKKRYKMDGAFYSFVSLAIGGETKGNGVLNITSSTYEGFDTEMHLTVDSGTITINAPDDAINVNEDDVSVFTMLDGNLTITSENGDGIDSNGYVVIHDGTLDITAGTAQVNANGEGGIDAEKGTYISSSASYTWHAANSGGGNGGDGGNNGGGQTPPGGTPESDDVTPLPDPVSTDTSYKQDGADTSMKITTSNGTTTFDMGGSTSFIVPDTDTSSRDIPASGNVFPLTRKVNTFSNIK